MFSWTHQSSPQMSLLSGNGQLRAHSAILRAFACINSPLPTLNRPPYVERTSPSPPAHQKKEAGNRNCPFLPPFIHHSSLRVNMGLAQSHSSPVGHLAPERGTRYSRATPLHVASGKQGNLGRNLRSSSMGGQSHLEQPPKGSPTTCSWGTSQELRGCTGG